MKAKELAEIFLEHPDFDVQVVCMTGGCTYNHPYPEYTTCEIDDVADIGYSSKVICLEGSVY